MDSYSQKEYQPSSTSYLGTLGIVHMFEHVFSAIKDKKHESINIYSWGNCENLFLFLKQYYQRFFKVIKKDKINLRIISNKPSSAAAKRYPEPRG